jgi:hypothetical protein
MHLWNFALTSGKPVRLFKKLIYLGMNDYSGMNRDVRNLNRLYEMIYYPIVCTSTDNTAGKSRTMGVQFSPASGEA